MPDAIPPRLLSRAGLRAYMGSRKWLRHFAGLAWSDIALRMVADHAG